MQLITCDRCGKAIKNGSQAKEVHVLGFSGKLGVVDLCASCAPGFVKVVATYLGKRVRK